MQAYGLTADQQDELWQRWRKGEALRSVARQLGAPVQHVRRYVAQTGGVRPRPVGRSVRHLSLQEREEVSRGLAAGWSMRRIAAELERPPSTVSRESLATAGARPTALMTRTPRPISGRSGQRWASSEATIGSLRRCGMGLSWSGPHNR